MQRREWRSESAWVTCTTAALGKGCKHAGDECQEDRRTYTSSTRSPKQSTLEKEVTLLQGGQGKTTELHRPAVLTAPEKRNKLVQRFSELKSRRKISRSFPQVSLVPQIL